MFLKSLWLGKVVIAALVFSCVIYLVYLIGPRIETAYFPALGKFEFVKMVLMPDGQSTLVQVRFNKLRDHCDAGPYAWYLTDADGDFEGLDVTTTRTTNPDAEGRPPGWQLSQPFIIHTTPELLKTKVFAVTFSRCHPFWLTKSEVYP